MNILGRLALLFVVVPILELLLLIEMGQLVGLLPTLGLVMFTGIGGAMLARAEGVRVFFQFQTELARGRLPGQAMLDGISVLIGGAFLLTPGVLTDFAGFALLFPVTRRWIQRRVRKRLERQIADGTIRVVSMGTHGAPGFGGFGGFGFGGRGAAGSQTEAQSGQPGQPGATAGADGALGAPRLGLDPRDSAARAAAQAGKDPSKGIVIDGD